MTVYGSGRPQGANVFETKLIAELRDLKGFAIGLCGRTDVAEDLVQTTMLKALTNAASFTPGTNMRAWLVTILRNSYYSDFRTKWRSQPWDDMFDNHLALSTGLGRDQQDDVIDLKQILLYIASLRSENADAIIAVGYIGMSYEQAAGALGCAAGTIKSRLNRAREMLRSLSQDGVIISADLTRLKNATRKIPHDHPYFPIAQAYEELYTSFADTIEAPGDTAQKNQDITKKATISEQERLWEKLVASGALENQPEDLSDLLSEDSQE